MEWLNITGVSCSLTHSCGAKLGDFSASGDKCFGCGKFGELLKKKLKTQKFLIAVRQRIYVDKSKVDKVTVSIAN